MFDPTVQARMPDMVAQLHPMWCKLVPPRQSPLRPETWRSLLGFHPDKDFVDVVMAGIEFGWDLHYMASAALPPTAPTRGCTQICARTSRDQSERIRTTFPSRPLPFISGRPRAPSRKLRTAKTGPAFKRLSDKIRHVVDTASL